MHKRVICKGVGAGEPHKYPGLAAAGLSPSFGQRKRGRGLLYSGKRESLAFKEEISLCLAPISLTQPYREGTNTLAVFSPILQSLLVLPIGQTQPEARGHWSLCMGSLWGRPWGTEQGREWIWGWGQVDLPSTLG